MFKSLKEKTGAEKLRHPFVIAVIVLVSVMLSYTIAVGGLVTVIALFGFLLGFALLFWIFRNPKVGVISLLILSFVAIGLTRYIRGVPLGMGIDGLLVISIVAIFFKNFYKDNNLSQLNRDIVYLLFFWFAYTVLEFFNPQAQSKIAWFYAMRGISFYSVLLVPLGLLLFKRLRYLYLFLYIWGVFSILGTLKGLMQVYIGLDAGEQFWIDTIGGITHIVNGRLRIFSFFSDAGQFGAAQGAAGIVGILVFISVKGRGNKIFFLIMGIMGLWGMMLSGTRGAMIVPLIASVVYLILKRSKRILFIGGVMLVLIYVFFAHTWVAESYYRVARMRTAFRLTEDASYQVRLKNRAILKTYLADKPFGGGIGSAGNWGKRFSPSGFLANVATDSWYVQVWAEQGIIGLFFHLFILSFILLKGFYLVMVRVKNVELQGIFGALIAAFAGIMGASYGNGVLGQIPTSALVYLSWAFIFMSQQLDREYSYIKSIGKSPSAIFLSED